MKIWAILPTDIRRPEGFPYCLFPYYVRQAYLKSMKITFNVGCNSTPCSIIFGKMNIWSTVLRPARPRLSPKMLSIPFCYSIYYQSCELLPVTDAKVITVQFPHSVRLPFFANLTISSCFHIFGTFLVPNLI